ncbi:uncharacterized protein ACB058_020263 [Synchiropus picturatus]
MDVKGANRGRSEGRLMDADRICFSCDKIFANRKFLEEHVCPSANYICSCGTEFSNYPDMLYHSTTHQTGHQMLHHQTIKKRRIEKSLEVEEKLKRLESGDVIWKVPESGIVSSSNEKVLYKSAQQNLKTHNLDLSVSENILHPETSVKGGVFGLGAPTVDLWTLYQPVVVVRKESNSVPIKPFSCGKCGETFLTKNALVFHSSSHFTDKISGCIGCGLLLCSKKQMPRFHVCNSPSRSSKLRLITARPLSQQNPLLASPGFLGSKQPSPATKNSPPAQVNSVLLPKKQYLGAYSKKGQGPQVSSSPQLKSQNPAKPYTESPLSKKTPLSPNTQQQVPTKQLGMSMNTAMQFKPWQPSPGANSFNCKVCHSPFESAHLLQRHKCPKAKEFMARQLQAGKRPYKVNEAKVSSPNIFPTTKDQKAPPTNGSVTKSPVTVVNLDDETDVIPIKVTVGSDVEDDCYIIESGEDKPAEMIYQVTSSVPIKT